jgi:hypothetical protein
MGSEFWKKLVETYFTERSYVRQWGLEVLNYETDTARMQTRQSSGKRGQRCFAAKQSI